MLTLMESPRRVKSIPLAEIVSDDHRPIVKALTMDYGCPLLNLKLRVRGESRIQRQTLPTN
jgi:hypothetical protein